MMITVTDLAQEKVLEFMEAEDKKGLSLRLKVIARGPRQFEYDLNLEPEEDRREDDEVLDFDGFKMVLDPSSALHVEDATMDFVQRGLETGFKFDNPNAEWRDPLAQAVQDVLNREINPMVAGHGGHIELLDVKDDTAYIALGGGCQGCGMADVTLKQGIEVAIREAVPQITHILDTTDHAAGANPYFQPSKGGDSPF